MTPAHATPPVRPPLPITERLRLYGQLIRFDKPVGTLLLLWPTLTALWIAADGVPSWHIVLIFSLGTFLMRSAGCAINDWADRHVDLHVERTRHRPITSGRISGAEALWVAAVLAIVAGLLILPLNLLTWAYAVLAVGVAASYPFFKRFFPVPQAWLGIAFSFGIPMGFAAVQNDVPPMAWLLLAANLLWVIAYDTEYALVDMPDDLKIGIRTSAITFGRHVIGIVMACHAGHLALMAVAGALAGFGWPWWVAMVGAAVLALRDWTLIRHKDRADCFRAFRENHRLGALLWIGAIAATALR
ncbi:4-hydroxybenzoate octaprenyltransferase [Derxia gummosa]|uniref:4-hydroxybenzoate octaprenyltransferase n=1 Tax=Derxia gummosa DSM 723 TaxID=1121388 RepID=A0A8B6X869_9BURK|nr:4-hydroxybenzoate octaprenyltransferase [Derxia gummosa]